METMEVYFTDLCVLIKGISNLNQLQLRTLQSRKAEAKWHTCMSISCRKTDCWVVSIISITGRKSRKISSLQATALQA
uniref:Uncharacterized protein n=1 Tax=Nelumbo nucifera TaxID=4432 RepID=A0A822ZCG6_NELNU|nr:TPA_asm: hypothetical protein HUJ06_001062 [Nelumbo nucifera]